MLKPKVDVKEFEKFGFKPCYEWIQYRQGRHGNRCKRRR